MNLIPILRGLDDVVTFPAYVIEYRGRYTQFYCDKVWRDPLTGMAMRSRYRLTRDSCECLGYLKTGDCKHKKILTGREYVTKGVPKSYAVVLMTETICVMSDEAEAAKKCLIDPDTLPDIVKELAIVRPKVEFPYRIAWVKRFLHVGEIAMSVTAENFQTLV